MVLPETIRASIAEAVAHEDVEKGQALLREAAAAQQTSLDSGHRDRVGLKLLVLTAEAALQLQVVDVADWALKTYDLEARRYKSTDSGAIEVVQGKDQFWCRCQFAKALLGRVYALGLKGPELVKATLDAVQHLLNGLEVVLATPRYTFMAYNCSVHYWHVTRVMQRDGVRQHLLPSMEQIVKAVDTVPGQQEWKVQLKSNLALCYQEAGRAADAQKVADEAYVLAKQHVKPLAHKMLALKMHLGEGKTPPPADVDASTKARAILQGLKTAPGATTAEQKAQRLKGAADDARSTCGGGPQEAWVLVDPGGPEGETVMGVDLHVVSEIAWVASLNDVAEIAKPCMARAIRSQTLHPRVRAELTQNHRAVAELGPPSERSTRCNLPPGYIDTCIRVVKKTAELLSSVLRLNDPELVQDSCMIIWNTGLILLQLDLRPQVQQPFNQAAAALERIASPLHRLRVLFHLELAGCYIAEDVLITANKQVDKALAIDYVTTQAEVEQTQYDRPMDYYLFPLRKMLALKTSIYDPPEVPEEQALLLIESAKEARTTKVKAECLSRAVGKLAPLAPITLDPENPNREQTHAAKARAVLWGDIVTYGAVAKQWKLVHDSAPYVLEPKWDVVNDKLMVLLQAECSLKDAEACMALVEAEGEELVPLEPEPETPPPGDDEDDLDEALPEQPHEVDQWLERACTGIVDCMTLAHSSSQPWLVMNAAIVAWNRYLPLVRDARYAELLPLLVPVFDNLKKLEDPDPALLCSVADALACGWEHKFYLERAKDPDVYSFKALLGSIPHEEAKGSAELEAAVAVCDAAIHRASEKDKRRLCATSARCKAMLHGPPQIQDVDPRAARAAKAAGGGEAPAAAAPAAAKGGKGGAAEPAEREPIAEAIAHIEILIQPRGDKGIKRRAVNAAVMALEAADYVDVELWAKLARGAYAIDDFANAIYAGRKAVSVLPPDFADYQVEEMNSLRDKTDWYWMAIAETTHGKGLVSLMRPAEHTLEVQETMKQHAIGRFVSATKFGVLAGARKDYVDTPVRCFWNAAISFMGSSMARQILLEPLRTMLPLLRSVKQPSAMDPPLVADMYVVLLEALGDAGKWDEGLRTADIAFRNLPQKEHSKLWGLKVMFLCNATDGPGGNILDRMEAVQAYGAELQAKVWSMLAQQHPRRYEQFMAHINAIDALSEQPWLQVDYMVDFAEWLYKNGEPVEDVEDVLLSAADSILSIERGPSEADDGVAGSDARSVVSYRSGISRSSSKSKGTNRTAKTAKSARTNKTAKTDATKKSAKSTKAGAGADDIKPPQYLTIRHMRLAVRIFLSLSDIASTHAGTMENLLLAHHYGVRMIKTMLTEVAVPGSSVVTAPVADPRQGTAKRHSRPGSKAGSVKSDATGMRPASRGTSVTGSEASSRSSRRSKASSAQERERLKKAAAAAAAAEARQRKPAHVDIPTAYEGWATLHLSDEVRTILGKTEDMGGLGEMGLDLETLGRPELFLQYLFYMEGQLVRAGLHLHMLPLYQLGCLVAEVVMRNEEMARAVRLRMIYALENLRMMEAAQAAEAAVGPLELTKEELIAPRAQRAQALAVKATMLQPRDPAVQSMATPKLLPTQPQQIWLEKGRFLVRRCQTGAAAAFLEEALEHAQVMDDYGTTVEAKLLLAQNCARRLEYERGIALLVEAQALMQDYDIFTENFETLLACKAALPDGADVVKEDLEKGVAFLQQRMLTETAGGVLECRFLLTELLTRLADSKLAVMRDAIAHERERAYVEAKYEDALATARQAEATIADDGGPAFTHAVLTLGMVLAANPYLPEDPRPYLRDVHGVLLRAQAEAVRTLKIAQPVGTSSTVGLPAARQLGEVAEVLGDLNLALAAADTAMAAADLAATRPAFPLAEDAEGPAVAVEAFLDDTHVAPPQPSMTPDHEAVLAASKAANLAAAHPTPHTRFLRLFGRSLGALHAAFAPGGTWGALRELPPPPPTPPPEPAEGEEEAAAAAATPPAPDPVRKPSVDVEGLEGSAAAGWFAAPPELPSPPLPYREQSVAAWQATIAQGLRMEDFATVGRAAMEVAMQAGKADERVAAEHIMLSQSCRVRERLSTILCNAAGRGAREHLLLSERAFRLRERQESPESPAVRQNTAYLEELSPAWPLLQVEAPTAEALETVPDWARVVALHLSEDRRWLYCACARNPREGENAEAAGKGGKGKPAKGKEAAEETEEEPEPAPVALVERIQVDPDRLSRLLRAVTAYKRTMEKFLSEEPKGATTRPNTVMTTPGEQTLADESGPAADPPTPAEGEAPPATPQSRAGSPSKKGKGGKELLPKPVLDTLELSAGWQQILGELEALFGALAGTLHASFASLLPRAGAEEPPPPLQVLLLVDPVLAPLPWEALEALAPAAGVGRDFSFATLHRRLQKLAAATPSDPKAKAVEGAGGVNPCAFEYMVDLHAEDSVPLPPPRGPVVIQHPFRDSNLMAHMLKKEFIAKVPTAKDWKGVEGVRDQIIGDGKLEAMMNSSEALLYFGMGRFLSYVGIRTVSRTVMPGCKLVVLLDQVRNESVFRKQQVMDTRRSLTEVESEQPYETAALLSMRGVTSVVLNTYPTLPDENYNHLYNLFTALAAGGSLAPLVQQAAKSPHKQLEMAGKKPTTPATKKGQDAVEPPPPPPRIAYHPFNAVVYGLGSLPVLPGKK